MVTINIVGTGGIIEGNLGSHNVDVNLDTARQFDGSDDYITTANSATLENLKTFTYAFWIYSDNASTRENIIYKGTNVQMEVTAGNVITAFRRYGTTNDAATTSTTLTTGSWNHVAWTATAGAAAPKIYINGVEAAYSSQTAGAGTDTDDSGSALTFGGAGTVSIDFGGKLADIRVYNAALSADNIAVLASKINTDSSLGAGTSNLKLWYKLDGSEAAGSGNVPDDSPQSNTGTLTGTSVDYDAFSVNVQDNSTTTDGTFTVTQGKVEGKALTSLTYDGSSDNVDTEITFQSEIRTGFSMSAWVKPDDGITGGNQALIGAFTDSNHSFVLYIDSGAGKLSARIVTDGVTKYAVEDSASFVDGANPWKHVVFTTTYVDSSNATMKLYVDGVERTLNSTNNGALAGNLGNYNGSDIRIGINPHAGGFQWDFAGEIRGVRFNDNVLTADQIASLYSNTYPVTPDYWWKMDDNLLAPAGAAYVESFGTKTDPDAVRNGATYNNGTLDLDGTLTIAANGTLSAPRGTLTSAEDFDATGTFTHNSGTVEFDNSAEKTLSGTDGTVYHKLLANNSDTRTVSSGYDFTVENSIVTNSGKNFKIRNTVITLGTTTSAGTITNNGVFAPRSGGQTMTLQGASSLFPFTATGNAIAFDGGGSSHNWSLANADIQTAVTTGGASMTITLTGDCEFDAVTVSDGDTLDLNGQRMECSGTLSVPSGGTLDADGLLFASNIDMDSGTPDNITSCDTVLTGSGTVDNENSSGLFRTLMFNGTGKFQPNNGHMLSATNVIIANEVDCNDVSQTGPVNITVPTGGTLDGDSATLTVAGDLTMSGGLIGKSALDFEGSGHVEIDDDNALDFTTAMTLEGWVKTTATGNFQHLICKSGGFYFISVYNAGGGATGKAMIRIYDGANIDAVGTSQVNDGKWHHIAGTYDTSAGKLKLYVDGKLEAETSNSDAIHTSSTNLFLGANDDSGSSNTLTGVLGRASLWNVALTEAQIRSRMFSDFASLDSNTGCIAWYQFDEGTGGNGDTTANSVGSSHTGTLGPAGTAPNWAGAGTFTQGTSTVDMTGTGTLTYEGTTNFNILKVAASSKTTTIQRLSAGDIYINTNLYKGAGTLTRSGTLGWRLSQKTGVGNVDNSGLVVSGASYPVDLSNTYVVYYHDSTIAKEVKWNYFINGSDTTLLANQESTGYWHNASYATDVGDYELKCHHMKYSDAGGGKFLMGSGKLEFSTTAGLSLSYPSNTFSVGPGAIVSGSSAATTFMSQNDFSVVGNIENLDVTNEELTVLGNVTNCTGDIHRWNPTIDTGQMLDADTADDRDVRLGSDLDRNTELVT